VRQLCTNPTLADSPIYWKRYQLEVKEGAVGVEFGAPQAGALLTGVAAIRQVQQSALAGEYAHRIARIKRNGLMREKFDRIALAFSVCYRTLPANPLVQASRLGLPKNPTVACSANA
jgi:hypothetical protein